MIEKNIYDKYKDDIGMRYDFSLNESKHTGYENISKEKLKKFIEKYSNSEDNSSNYTIIRKDWDKFSALYYLLTYEDSYKNISFELKNKDPKFHSIFLKRSENFNGIVLGLELEKDIIHDNCITYFGIKNDDLIEQYSKLSLLDLDGLKKLALKMFKEVEDGIIQAYKDIDTYKYEMGCLYIKEDGYWKII